MHQNNLPKLLVILITKYKVKVNILKFVTFDDIINHQLNSDGIQKKLHQPSFFIKDHLHIKFQVYIVTQPQDK